MFVNINTFYEWSNTMVIKFIDSTERYHEEMDGIVKYLENYLTSLDIRHYRLKLSDMKIVRCSLCRACTMQAGFDPVKCVLKDDLNDAIDQIEEADGYIILADRNNLFSQNKIHSKFVKRLVAYHYWPLGQSQSTPRRIELQKKSLLINYNTTKYFMNHTFYTAKQNMSRTSLAIGAKVVDWLAMTPNEEGPLVDKYKEELLELTYKLVRSLKVQESA